MTFNPDNVGLATAQNQGIRQALVEGFAWILLMDDDSYPEPDMVGQLLAMYAALSDPALGILAPRLMEQNVSAPVRYLLPRGRFGCSRRALVSGQRLLDVAMVIASGSLIRAELFTHIGLMADDLFIDYVDFDFCLRARQHGYGIAVCGDAVLRHRQGHKRQSLAGIVTQNHSPLRRYFIFRNRMFLLRRYGMRFPFLLAHESLAYGWDMLRIVLLETQKVAKLTSALRGFMHGLTQPLPNPSRAQPAEHR
jgi:rhamnosyltransferase